MKCLKSLLLLALYIHLKCFSQTENDVVEDQQLKTTYELDNVNINDAVQLSRDVRFDLNSVSRDELQSLGILSITQLDNFFAHKTKYGKLLSIYELKVIPDFDNETIEEFLSFVFVRDLGIYRSGNGLLKDILDEDNNYIITRTERSLQSQRGYSIQASPGTQYLGNPYKYYIRYRIANNHNFSMGLTMEKDAGEQFLWDHSKRQYGFDHLVMHFQLKNRGLLKNLILGNFSVSAGQGLVFANGMYIAKSSESVLFVKRNQMGIMPFNSILESGYFKGLAATVALKKVDLTVFASQKRRDSEINSDTNSQGESYINSIYTSGFHRTIREFDTKNTVNQYDLGYNVRWSSPHFNIGHSSVFTSFQDVGTGLKLDIIPKSYVYNANAFRGSSNWVSSIDFNYYFKNINLFGELAQQMEKGRALVLGTQCALGAKMDLALLYRNYNPYFNSFYANGFGEYFNNNDEQGAYIGAKYTHNRKLVFTAYYDLFKNKQLKYGQYTPGLGSEYLLSATYKPHKKVSFYLQWRQSVKPKNLSADEGALYTVVPTLRSVITLALKYDLEQRFSLQTKLYRSVYHQTQRSTGLVLAQDMVYKVKKWSVSARFALFDTDGYDTRIYLYEKDVLYSFSFPAYQGKGLRYYLIAQYSLNKRIKLWVRWVHTQYHDRQSIGAAGELIRGSRADEVKVQLKWLLGAR